MSEFFGIPDLDTAVSAYLRAAPSLINRGMITANLLMQNRPGDTRRGGGAGRAATDPQLVTVTRQPFCRFSAHSWWPLLGKRVIRVFGWLAGDNPRPGGRCQPEVGGE